MSDADRQACCDSKVQSDAGREYCYFDVIYQAGLFDECEAPTFVEVFECCETLSKGEKNMEFDCKFSLNGEGYCPKDDEDRCERNYLRGVEIFEAHKAEQLLVEK